MVFKSKKFITCFFFFLTINIFLYLCINTKGFFFFFFFFEKILRVFSLIGTNQRCNGHIILKCYNLVKLNLKRGKISSLTQSIFYPLITTFGHFVPLKYDVCSIFIT